jgi:renalase
MGKNSMSKPKIAIIGAGIAGLTLAHALKDHAIVTVFEKARGVSGRMSTRYADPYQFDHAAQYFTARSKAFKQFLKPHIASGLVAEWKPKVMTLKKGATAYKRDWFEPHYVAAPKMNDLCKHLSSTLDDVRLPAQVAKVEKAGAGWQISDNQTEILGVYDWVISAAPCHQTALLLPEVFAHHEAVSRARMVACFTLMLGFDDVLPVNFDAAKVHDSPIEWISLNHSKPERTHKPSIVVTTQHEWSEVQKNDNLADVQMLLLNELSELLHINAHEAASISLHRWLYAGVAEAVGEDYLLDSTHQLAACGDWCIEGRIEAAFLSGHRLGTQLLTCI